MVSFDHRDAGTAEREWAASARWHSVPQLDVRAAHNVVVIAAHPDDETLGAGGLIAGFHGVGAAITIILATRGEQASSRDLSSKRLAEFRLAIERLAPDARFVDLALPDAALAHHIPELSTATINAATGPDLIIAPWRGDGHTDHSAAGAAAALAALDTGARLLEYPIWLWHWAGPNDPPVPWDRFVRLALDPAARGAKMEALAAYASQTAEVDGDAPTLHSGMLAHFDRGWETFVETPT